MRGSMKGAVAALLAASLISVGATARAELADLGHDQYVPVGDETVPAGKYTKEGPYKIGVALPGLFTPWLIQEMEEIKHEASLHPEIGELIIIASDGNAERQASDVEDMLTKGVDALLLSPVSETSVNAQIERAAAAGIPVVTFSTTSNSDKVDVKLVQGGEGEGRVLVDWLVDHLGGKGDIWAIRGAAGNSEDVYRYEGVKKALEGSEVTISAEGYGDWNYAKGKQLCETFLLSGKPVDGVYATGGMVRGCIEAFQEVGAPVPPITGENDNGFLRAIKASGTPFVGATYSPAIGPVGLRAALAMLSGQEVARNYYGNSEVITTENLDDYFREDLNDSFYAPSALPDETLKELFGN